MKARFRCKHSEVVLPVKLEVTTRKIIAHVRLPSPPDKPEWIAVEMNAADLMGALDAIDIECRKVAHATPVDALTDANAALVAMLRARMKG